jgi:hypothetical protein
MRNRVGKNGASRGALKIKRGSISRYEQEPEMRIHGIKLLDISAILISVLVASFFCVNALLGNDGSPCVHVKCKTGEYVYALDRDTAVDVAGPLGSTRIVIDSGRVCIADSPCPGKICVHSGRISNSGEWIACLPNRVLVYIESRKKNEVDATSR